MRAMPQTLSITELVRNFADYVNRIAYRGERFRVTRGGKPVAEIGPVPTRRSLVELPDLIASLPRLSEREAADFAADIDMARDELGYHMAGDPWTS